MVKNKVELIGRQLCRSAAVSPEMRPAKAPLRRPLIESRRIKAHVMWRLPAWRARYTLHDAALPISTATVGKGTATEHQ
jgi:hypothetical protein